MIGRTLWIGISSETLIFSGGSDRLRGAREGAGSVSALVYPNCRFPKLVRWLEAERSETDGYSSEGAPNCGRSVQAFHQ